jgi:hypothetical protein
MRTFTKIIILATLLCTGAGLKAQTFTASYIYDANGNRQTATVVYLSQSPSTPDTNTTPKIEDELPLDQGKNLTINIFPNPTQGDLRVELIGATPEQLDTPSNAIKVWDMQGRLLFSIGRISTSNVVDLSHYTNGTYIMQLFFCGKVKDFRVVKN